MEGRHQLQAVQLRLHHDRRVAVRVIAEDGAAFDPAPHDIVQGAGRTFRTKCGSASKRGPRGIVGGPEHKTSKDATTYGGEEGLPEILGAGQEAPEGTRKRSQDVRSIVPRGEGGLAGGQKLW
jgi:hypothetical protein